jgi:hypothetical protein
MSEHGIEPQGRYLLCRLVRGPTERASSRVVLPEGVAKSLDGAGRARIYGVGPGVAMDAEPGMVVCLVKASLVPVLGADGKQYILVHEDAIWAIDRGYKPEESEPIVETLQ